MRSKEAYRQEMEGSYDHAWQNEENLNRQANEVG